MNNDFIFNDINAHNIIYNFMIYLIPLRNMTYAMKIRLREQINYVNITKVKYICYRLFKMDLYI